ncbi:MAG: histidine kinase [Candidatus Methanomethylophilaceae archaeon]|nr:histidine kinase [Candidatus Methanomethylophilaceae archaeon]
MVKVTDWSKVGYVSMAVLALMLIVTSRQYADAIYSVRPYYVVVNQSMDIFGMGVCILLFITILFDHRINVGTIYFMAFITLESMLLFWDFESWMVDGNPNQVVLNNIINYYNYGFVLLVLVTFWLYVKHLADTRDSWMRGIEIVHYTILLLGLAIILTNPWTSAVFTIDPETGLYARADTYWISLIAPICMIGLNTIAVYRYVKGSKKKIGLYSYALMPIAGALVQYFFYGIGVIYIAMLFSLILIYGNFYVEKGQEITRKNAEITERKVSMMIAHIQPEVLTRTLESIKNIEGNPPETVSAIEHFSNYMRGNLQTLGQIETVPFATEMKHVRTYVDLEKLRFKEKLNVRYDIRDTSFHIPALTLQMLVENAIKHGVTVKEGGGTVEIATRLTAQGHVITISDDGVGFDVSKPLNEDDRSHIGLANVKQRLEEMSNGKLSIRSEIGRGTMVKITIPRTSMGGGDEIK